MPAPTVRPPSPDREGLAHVERDRLSGRGGDLHRLPWQGLGGLAAACVQTAEVRHAGYATYLIQHPSPPGSGGVLISEIERC